MKFKDLERVLIENKYFLVRRSKHLIYSNGVKSIAIPHQKEVNKMLAKRVLKECQEIKF